MKMLVSDFLWIEFLSHGYYAEAQVAAKMLLALVRSNVELSGRCSVVWTSPNGLQVWCELRESRKKPRLWFREAATKDWYCKLGRKMVHALRKSGAKGGKVSTIEYLCIPRVEKQ